MTWIILTILLLLIAGLLWWGAKKVAKSTDPDAKITSLWMKVASGIAIFAFLLLTVFSMYQQVPVGNVGLVYTFGNITGQTGAGLQWIAPWETLTTANVKIQAAKFDLASFSKETQDVNVNATLNYHVAPQDIQNLYKTIGPNWFNVLVPTRVNQAFKDETVKFAAVEIAPNRDTIRHEVLDRLKRDLSAYSIHVDDLNINNITFSKAFTKAIEDKQIAVQQAAAAHNRVATAQAQAQALIKQAQGQAEANRLRRRTLTPLLVQQNAIDKLNPNVRVIIVPATGNFLLGNLFSKNNG